MKNIELKFLKNNKPMMTSKIAIKDLTKDHLEERLKQAEFIANYNKGKTEGLIRIVDNELRMRNNGTWNALDCNITSVDIRDVLKTAN